MDTLLSLRNHLLIAMPSIQDVFLKHAVIYVCESQPQGTVGLMINRPLAQPLGFIFEQMNIEPIRVDLGNRPLLLGGPEQPERGFVIHRPFGHWNSSLLLGDEVTITTSSDIIRALARDDGPKDVLVALGFVWWNRLQLEKEMLNNHWLVCPYQSELLYEVPFAQRWEHAALTLGVKMDQFIEGGGHA